MPVFSLPIGLLVGLDLLLLALLLLPFQRSFGNSSQHDALTGLTSQTDASQKTLSGQFPAMNVDIAARLEQTTGDLRQQVSDRLNAASKQFHDSRGDLCIC